MRTNVTIYADMLYEKRHLEHGISQYPRLDNSKTAGDGNTFQLIVTIQPLQRVVVVFSDIHLTSRCSHHICKGACPLCHPTHNTSGHVDTSAGVESDAEDMKGTTLGTVVRDVLFFFFSFILSIVQTMDETIQSDNDCHSTYGFDFKPRVSRTNRVAESRPAHLDLKSSASLTAGTTRVALRRCAILLLTGVPSRTALRRALLLTAILLTLRRVSARLLAITLLRRLSILTSVRWLSVRLLAWGRTVLAWWGSTVLAALLGWATVALLGGSAVTAAWGSAVAAIAARCRVGLLVLGIVRAVDGTEKELDDP